MAKAATFKIPSNIAQAVDLYYKTREDRLALQRQVDAMEANEKTLKEHLINSIPKSQATGVAGKLARVSITQKVVAQVDDWDKFYEYVAKNRNKGGFALLNRAVNQAAVREIWEANKKVPGVGPFTTTSLSINKL